MRASRILRLARAIRLPIAGSATRNAWAISAVVRPPSVRSVRATCADGSSAGWQQVKISRSRSSAIMLASLVAGCSCSSRRTRSASRAARFRWDLIAAQYDQMIKYATAIRTGTVSTEAILRRFTKANTIHPAYQAIAETGRAQRTIFLARYLRDRDLQREIVEGLNVVESWNRANAVIFFGKGGDIATNRRDEQELSVLCLRVLQAALVYVNTLMVQDVVLDG